MVPLSQFRHDHKQELMHGPVLRPSVVGVVLGALFKYYSQCVGKFILLTGQVDPSR
jgi:hypothetical protein